MTEAAIRTKERGWIHASRIKGPVDEPKEWTITSEPGSMQWWRIRGPRVATKDDHGMAQSNANDVCKRIILGLPVSPPPILDLLIETCTKRAIMDQDEQKKGPGLRGWIAAPATIPP
ncbi:hypothetical protein DUI87_03409 [Hirundo rustica rustica]|uniref:Uncharacterized protein n=1 Tax=Hirundo rustica rustica TaxID=333673 RepID=A0A3M0L7A0_HIRRU|nr:hypothetical protein DUI87_03409 [Hirundo rustica rustica]